MDKLISILQGIQPDIDYNTCKTLIEDRIFSSIDIISLVAELSDEFDIEISPEDLVPESFNSLEAMWAMIKRLQDE